MTRPKRPNGAGSIDRVRGKWRVRIFVDGKRKQYGPLYDTEEQAARALAAYQAERDGHVTPGDITLATFGAEWLDHREKHGSRRRERVRSIATERSAWNRHVATSELADKPVAEITPKHVDAFAHAIRKTKAVHTIAKGIITDRTFDHRVSDRTLSRSSQRHILRLLRQCFDHAIREEIISTNPAEKIRELPGGRRPKDLSDDWLRVHEIGAVLVCEKIALADRAAYAVAIGTALRKDDLRLLEVDRIHLDAEVPGPHVRVWVSKSERWHGVPIMPWLDPVLRAYVASLPHGARFLFSPDADHKTPYAPGHGFRWAGKPTSKGYERSALEKAGVARRVRFHDLRGTTATHLALGSWGRAWTLHEIQQMLAHSDQRVTERYVRRAVNLLAEAAKATPGGPDVGPRWPREIVVSVAPPPGIEPGTVRLEGQRIEKEVRADRGAWHQRVANLVAQLPTTIADGDLPAELRAQAIELAKAHPLVRAYLALVSDPDGPLAFRALLRLLEALPSGGAEALVESETR